MAIDYYNLLFTNAVGFAIGYFFISNTSEWVSELGLYHQIEGKKHLNDNFQKIGYIVLEIFKGLLGIVKNKSSNRHNFRSYEKLSDKISYVGRIYLYLSFLLVLSIFIILSSNIFINIENSNDAIVVSITLSMLFLLIFRLLSNTDDFPNICGYFLSKEEKKGIYEQHRERILSFLFSLIATTILLALSLFCYLCSTSPSSFPNPKITDVDWIGIFIFSSFLYLFVVIFGEIFLFLYPPKHQIPS